MDKHAACSLQVSRGDLPRSQRQKRVLGVLGMTALSFRDTAEIVELIRKASDQQLQNLTLTISEELRIREMQRNTPRGLSA